MPLPDKFSAGAYGAEITNIASLLKIIFALARLTF